MKKLLLALLIAVTSLNALKARPPIIPKKVKKELLDLISNGAIDESNAASQRYIQYVTDERQIKYLTVQVNEIYGYINYLDRLKLASPLEYEEKRSHLSTMQKDIIERCQKDYSCMDSEGLSCFCHYSRRIAYLIVYDRQMVNR
jgi:hypothetical protein